jgi:hypothetical protein
MAWKACSPAVAVVVAHLMHLAVARRIQFQGGGSQQFHSGRGCSMPAGAAECSGLLLKARCTGYIHSELTLRTLVGQCCQHHGTNMVSGRQHRIPLTSFGVAIAVVRIKADADLQVKVLLKTDSALPTACSATVRQFLRCLGLSVGVLAAMHLILRHHGIGSKHTASTCTRYT